jgi:hypothetical protein
MILRLTAEMLVDKMPDRQAIYDPVGDHNRFPDELQDKFLSQEGHHVAIRPF